jgi:hypothetical protein
MKYENPEVCSQLLQQEFFHIMLKMMTQLNKSVKAEELPKVLKFAKKAAAYCSDVVREDIQVKENEESSKFWNQVYHLNNQ